MTRLHRKSFSQEVAPLTLWQDLTALPAILTLAALFGTATVMVVSKRGLE